jgi:oligopeptide/dipeptide ABC transporter ATP-binding protein
MIFQDPYSSLDPRMTVASIVREPLIAQHGRRAATDQRIDDLLDEVGLRQDVRDRRPAQLSGGQRQRVGIARALALDPRVIIADEAVSALDVSVQATVLNLLRELQRERELTYLFISHDLDVVRYLCHRVAVMYLGKLVEVGDTEQVYNRPAHPYTAALLSSVPGSETGHGERLRGEVPSADQVPSGCRFHTRCPLAGERCREVTPQLLGDPRQRVACHYPLVERDPELVG